VFFAKKYSLEVQSWLINDDTINSLGIPVLQTAFQRKVDFHLSGQVSLQ
jgi:hypothetical protein